MPNFTYTGADERYYPSLSLEVKPGDTVTLDSDPGDGRFSPASGKAKAAPTPAPEITPAPNVDSPEVGA